MPLLFLLSTLAQATEVTVEAVDGQRAVVLFDDLVKGETPVVTDVDGGEVTLAFRDSMFGPVLFQQKVTVPASGKVTFVVDVAQRSIEGGGGAVVPVPTPTPTPTPQPAAAAKTQVEVDSGEKGVEIVLDGKNTGKKTPATLEVGPGKHVITLAKGCSTGESEFTVDEGQTRKLQVDLEPAKVMLGITSTPPGATVTLDGKELGTTPMEAKVACGDRKLAVALEGYKAVEKPISLVKNDASVDFQLDKDAFGSMEITVEPEGVIKLDGDRVGTNTATLDKVSVGEHTLTVERSGVVVETRKINVKENATVMLTLVVPEPDTSKTPAPKEPKEPKEPKDPKAEKPSTGPSAIRLIANGVVTAGSVPLIALGTYNFTQAVKAVRQAELEPDDRAAAEIVRTQVRPREILAYTEWGVGGALLLTGATLWVTSFTDGSTLVVVPTGRGINISGRF